LGPLLLKPIIDNIEEFVGRQGADLMRQQTHRIGARQDSL